MTNFITLGARANERADHQITRSELGHFLTKFEEGGKITLGGTENQLIGPPLTGITYIEADWRTK